MDKVHTTKIKITINNFTRKSSNEKFGTITSREIIASIDGEICFKEWKNEEMMSKPEFSSIFSSIESYLLTQSRNDVNTTKNSTGNTRNFISRIKLIWRKLFLKSLK